MEAINAISSMHSVTLLPKMFTYFDFPKKKESRVPQFYTVLSVQSTTTTLQVFLIN